MFIIYQKDSQGDISVGKLLDINPGELGLVPGTHVKDQVWQYVLVPVLGVGVGRCVPGAPREASPV